MSSRRPFRFAVLYLWDRNLINNMIAHFVIDAAPLLL
jgi:membrane protease YdiL (CAAX protease family)